MTDTIHPTDDGLCSRECPQGVPNNSITCDCQAGGGCVVFYGTDHCLPLMARLIELARAVEEEERLGELVFEPVLLAEGEYQDAYDRVTLALAAIPDNVKEVDDE